MGLSLLQAVAALMSRCQRRLSQAARRLGLSRRAAPTRAIAPSGGGGGGSKKRRTAAAELDGGGGGGEEGVWTKEILMGERCQPLDFSGVIYYDAEGRRLAQPPPPRSPMRSPLPASFKIADAGSGGGY